MGRLSEDRVCVVWYVGWVRMAGDGVHMSVEGGGKEEEEERECVEIDKDEMDERRGEKRRGSAAFLLLALCLG